MTTTELREGQETALRALRSGSILWGGVGSGKSRVAVNYYLEKEAPRDIYVITTAKKRDTLDWDKEFVRHAIGKSPDTTVAGVMTVDSWNNIGKYVDVKNAFFIFDEQRIVGSGSWVKSFLKIAKTNHWILLTATPGDTWLDFAPVFIANGFYKNLTEFKREHVVYRPFQKFPVIDRYVNTGKLARLCKYVLVEMAVDRHTTRHTEIIEVEHDRVLMKRVMKDRWDVFKDRPLRGAAELYFAMRKVAYSDPSRLAAVRALLKKHPKLIVFYNFDYELEALRELKKDSKELKVSEWNGHFHEEIPKSASWVYLVQYTAAAEAWECIDTNAIVFYSLTYSYKLFEQSHGRIDRLNTSYFDLYYYILYSKAWIDFAVFRSLKAKKSFNESKSGLK